MGCCFDHHGTALEGERHKRSRTKNNRLKFGIFRRIRQELNNRGNPGEQLDPASMRANLALDVRRKIAATAANLLEHHRAGQRISVGMCNARNQSAMTKFHSPGASARGRAAVASDRPAEMGASHAHVPADIVGKLIVLGIVLAFSFAAPAAPAAKAIGARISDPQQDRQNAASLRPPSQCCETHTN